MPGALGEPKVGGRYVAAFVGAHCAFLPLLTFLLPSRVAAISDQPITDTSLLLIAGAVMASIANIAAGALSDSVISRRGSRRSIAAAGIGATALSLAGFALADSLAALLAALLVFQLSFNFLYAPLVAVLADLVPDSRKGITAAWLNFAIPLGTLATSATAFISAVLGPWIFPFVALIVTALVLPFLVAWPRSAASADPDSGVSSRAEARPAARRDFMLAWVARLCIQFGAAVVLSYLYLYVGQFGTGADFARDSLAELTLWATPVALAAGLFLGRTSDRASRRRPVLFGSSLLAAASLTMLVVASDMSLVAVGFVTFLASLTVFLALDSAMVAELISGTPRRGWALGWMNLTNTIPAIGAPLVTVGFSVASPDPYTIRLSLAVAAVAAIASAAAVAKIRSVG